MSHTCIFVTSRFPPPLIGGSLVFYYYLLSECVARDVVVLTRRQERTEEFDHARPYPICRSVAIRDPRESRLSRLWWFPMLVPLLVARILAWRAKVVHVGTWNEVVPAWLAARLAGASFVVTIHGEELTTDWSASRNLLFRHGWNALDLLAKRALCSADCIHTNSRFTESVLIRRGVDPTRILVMTPGIDVEKLEIEPSIKPDVAQRLGRKRVLLTVGRFEPRKGQDMVLKALPGLLKDYPDLHYVMAGGADGDAERVYRDAIEQLGLSDDVTLLTNLDNPEIAYLYQRCEVFVMANRTLANGDTEGYGIVFLEAGAHGKPVIGGRAGGAVEAVDDGVTGILVDGYDTDDISRAIRRLLEDPGLRETMGKAGAEKALGNAWKAKASDYLALLTRLSGRTCGSPVSH